VTVFTVSHHLLKQSSFGICAEFIIALAFAAITINANPA
jgi:hypothetical protein